MPLAANVQPPRRSRRGGAWRLRHAGHGHGVAGVVGLTGVAVGAAAGSSASTGSPAVALLAGIMLLLGLATILLGDVRRILLILIVLDIPLQLDVYLGFREDIASLAALGGFNVSVTTVALAGLYLLWAAELLTGAEGAPRPRLRAAAIPALFLAMMFVSLVVARDRVVAGFEIALITQMLLLFIYVASTVRSGPDLRLIVKVLLIAMLVEAILALMSYGSGGALALPGTAMQAEGPPGSGASRLSGTIGGPNGAGGYFAFMATFAVAIFLFSQDRGLRRLAAYSCVPAVIALALTLSRGAWIAFVVGCAVLALGGRGQLRRARVSPVAIVGMGLGLIAVLVPLQGLIAARVSGPDEGSAASRGPLAHLAFQIIGDHPIAGVGANNFAVVMHDYAGAEFSADWLSIAHNKYLLVWAELGTLGLAIFLAFLGATVLRGWRVRSAADPLVAALGIGIAAAVVGHATHLNFDTFKGRPMTETLWLASALLASPVVVRWSRRRADREDVVRRALTPPPGTRARRAPSIDRVA